VPKQPNHSQGTHKESIENKRNANMSHDPQDRAKNPPEREYASQAQEAGGEESKHGRKQKGNGDAI